MSLVPATIKVGTFRGKRLVGHALRECVSVDFLCENACARVGIVMCVCVSVCVCISYISDYLDKAVVAGYLYTCV